MVKVTLKGSVGQVLEHLRLPVRPSRVEDLMEGLDRQPHQALSLRADDAWWFERKESIEVYFHFEHEVVSCRIHIDDLEDWVRRARNLQAKRRLRRPSTMSKA